MEYEKSFMVNDFIFIFSFFKIENGKILFYKLVDGNEIYIGSSKVHKIRVGLIYQFSDRCKVVQFEFCD